MMKAFNVHVAAVLLFTGVSLVFGAGSKHAASKDKSSLTYVLVHPFHRVEGVSKEVACEIDYDDATHTILQVRFSADVMSFDSGNSSRDSHAMELVEALLFPSVSFESTVIAHHGSDLTVDGNLTFHGKTKPIHITATQTQSDSGLDVNGSTKISLTAFEVDRPSLLMIPVKDTLSISFTMVFPVKQ